jgi:cell division initiation protein
LSRLLPIDLVNAQFSKASFGGYKHDEVNDLIDRAAQALEDLTAENEDLRSQVVRLRAELDQLRGEERLVKDAIMSAQRAGELLRGDASREADLIREEARQQARAERSQAQQDAANLKDEVERLQVMRKRFVSEQRALLEKSLRDLDAIEPVTQAAVSMPVFPPAPEPVVAATNQAYPTRLGVTKPMDPIIVEDEDGEKWVS